MIDLCLKIVLRIFLLKPSMNSLKTHLSRKHMSFKLIQGCEILSLIVFRLSASKHFEEVTEIEDPRDDEVKFYKTRFKDLPGKWVFIY